MSEKLNSQINKGEWHEGKNIGRIASFNAGIPRDKTKSYTVYDIKINNIYGKQLALRYLVPFNTVPHNLIKDLKYLNDMNPKPWFEITLKQNMHNGLLQIVSMEEIKDKTQEEIELMSLEERGGRVTLN